VNDHSWLEEQEIEETYKINPSQLYMKTLAVDQPALVIYSLPHKVFK
jgi:hypothetical protein